MTISLGECIHIRKRAEKLKVMDYKDNWKLKEGEQE